MKLAIQIISWIMIFLCSLMLLSAAADSDTELLIGSVMFGVLPVLNLIYLKDDKNEN